MTTWSPTLLFNRRACGSDNLRPTAQKDFCNTIGTFETCRTTLRMSANRGRPEVSGFSVADLTSGKATHRIARQVRQGFWLCLGMTADRSYEPFGSLPGGSFASGTRRDANTRLTEISDADEPRNEDYLRELAFQRIS
jgi:hypothetical protein